MEIAHVLPLTTTLADLEAIGKQGSQRREMFNEMQASLNGWEWTARADGSASTLEDLILVFNFTLRRDRWSAIRGPWGRRLQKELSERGWELEVPQLYWLAQLREFTEKFHLIVPHQEASRFIELASQRYWRESYRTDTLLDLASLAPLLQLSMNIVTSRFDKAAVDSDLQAIARRILQHFEKDKREEAERHARAAQRK